MTPDTSAASQGADADAAEAPGTDPHDEVVELRLALWSARDAAIGAVAQAGTLRARNAELEALVHQLRVEIDRLAHVERSVTYRVGNTFVRPLRAARRLVR